LAEPPLPPGATRSSGDCHCFGSYRLTARPASLDAILVA